MFRSDQIEDGWVGHITRMGEIRILVGKREEITWETNALLRRDKRAWNELI
jgi:hypothetical protein